MLRKIFAIGMLCMLIAASSCVNAATTLTDPWGPNSVVNVDSANGLNGWFISNTNHMQQNCWFLRVGEAGTASAINTIGNPVVSQWTSDTATISYIGSMLTVDVTYTLIGSDDQSGMSDVSQSVVVTNNTASRIDVSLFEFMNFDLNGTSGNDTAWRDASSGNIYQSDGVNQSTVSQVGANGSKYWEISSASSLYNKLNNTQFSNLANATANYTGDAAWALQWDFSIAGHGSMSMSQDALIECAPVPEPGVLVSLGVGLLGLIPAIRRRH